MMCLHCNKCTSFEKLQISDNNDGYICESYQSDEFELEDSGDESCGGDDRWLEMSYNRYVEGSWDICE